jgi:glycosyltransferase involved in cell wall biosynthesis
MLLNENPNTCGTEKVSASIVVPCFNEEAALPLLRGRLHTVRRLLAPQYEFHLILLDDGSTDGTWRVLQQLFGSDPDCILIRQPANLGIAATILNGILQAKTEIVCSIDSDCTYDPQQLALLLPMMTCGVDLVTASPYHPLGKVQGAPLWRIFLSKTASLLYRGVLRQKLYTYTSCFRVYRRSVILNLGLRKNGFLGIAELIGKLDLQGSAIVECPAILTRRAHGSSKMNVALATLGHSYLLCEFLILRFHQMLLDNRRTELVRPNLKQS